MVHQLSGGAWGVVIRRPIGAAARVLPVMTALFLPIALGMSRLYPWTNADLVAHDEVLRHKQLYLNTPFFLARAALYFLVWNVLSYFLNAWSLEQDRNPDPRIARRMQQLSAGGLLAYGLTITFASFDWLMSLEPHWFSTIYGVLIMGGQGLSALAFLIVALVWLSRRPPLDRIVVAGPFPRPRQPPARVRDAVGLLLVFAVPDHLVGQPAGGNHVVHPPPPDRMAMGRHVARSVSFRRAVRAAVVPSGQTRPADAGQGGRRGIVVRLLDLFWLIAPEFHPVWRLGQLAGRRCCR